MYRTEGGKQKCTRCFNRKAESYYLKYLGIDEGVMPYADHKITL